MKISMITSSDDSGFKLTGSKVLLAMMAFFALVFTVNGLMAYLAVSTFSGVQTDKPYESGLAFNREIARARAQEGQGWQVDEQISREASGAVILTIRIMDGAHAPITGLTLNTILKSPADSHKDCLVVVTEEKSGVYSGTTHCAAGQWDLDTQAQKDGDMVYRSINRIILH